MEMLNGKEEGEEEDEEGKEVKQEERKKERKEEGGQQEEAKVGRGIEEEDICKAVNEERKGSGHRWDTNGSSHIRRKANKEGDSGADNENLGSKEEWRKSIVV